MPKPLVKWAGGKGRELEIIRRHVPSFERYIEPFLGGGSVFFDLPAKVALLNDISPSLIGFYKMVQEGRGEGVLREYARYFKKLLDVSRVKVTENLPIGDRVESILKDVGDSPLILDGERLFQLTCKSLEEKLKTGLKKGFWESENFGEYLATGIMAGFYNYQRSLLNDFKKEGRKDELALSNFYFMREYSYGGMFRFNSDGEFNVPYGGMSYNKKNFMEKVEYAYSPEIHEKLKSAEFSCGDFESFMKGLELTENDFIFLDPPYDTEFSTYDENPFEKNDQERLRDFLLNTPAKVVLVIKNTPFIFGLYEKGFQILPFEKNYSFNVKGRVDGRVEHLLIKNFA